MPKRGAGRRGGNAGARRSRSRSGTPAVIENNAAIPVPPPVFPMDPPLPPEAQPLIGHNIENIENIFPHPVIPYAVVADALQFATAALKQAQNARVIARIEAVFARFIEQLANGEPPSFEYELRGSAWNDFELAENGALRVIQHRTRWINVSVGIHGHVSKFVRVVELLGRIKTLLLTENYSTKRELYYENRALYDFDQRNTDAAIYTIGLLLKVPRSHLNILASSKGLVSGHLRFMLGDGIEIDCMHGFAGINIPSHLGRFHISHSDARMIFIIEKDASFQKFLSSGICHLFPCIIVTGKGYPDLMTREFVFRLRTLNIPMFAITDGDPHGFEIMCVYRYGCKAPHYENVCFAVPEIRWLGILPTDVDDYQLPDYYLTPMTQRNRQMAIALQNRPYCTPAFQFELNVMLERDNVAEIQGMTTFFQDNFLIQINSQKIRDPEARNRISLKLITATGNAAFPT